MCFVKGGVFTHSYACICRSLYSLEELVVCVIESHGESRVQYAPLHMYTEIDLQDIAVVQD